MKARYVAVFLILVIPALFPESIAQEDLKSKPVFGVRLNASYELSDFMQFSPALTLEIKNHNFYAGPQFNHFPNQGDDPDYYDSFGVNFGYRLSTNPIARYWRLFCQFNYSIYQFRRQAHQLGNSTSWIAKEIKFANTLSVGIQCNLTSEMSLYTGLGAGSNLGFFMIRDEVIGIIYFGVNYTF